jgi:predicted site-specific integrase-resolvase
MATPTRLNAERDCTCTVGTDTSYEHASYCPMSRKAKPTTVLYLRVPPDLAARIQYLAQLAGLSVNVYVTRVLDHHTEGTPITGKAA